MVLMFAGCLSNAIETYHQAHSPDPQGTLSSSPSSSDVVAANQ